MQPNKTRGFSRHGRARRANQFGFWLCGLSSPSAKNIPLVPSGKSILELAPSLPTEGRLAIVTDAGRDAVDANAP
jgi:hypothetical protein